MSIKDRQKQVITIEELQEAIKGGFTKELSIVEQDIEKTVKERFEDVEKLLSEKVDLSIESTNIQLMQMEKDLKEVISQHIKEDINNKLEEIQNTLMLKLNEQVAKLKENVLKEVRLAKK